ncbi:hypothetical protein [Virgibacillus salexigens]|uniref:hypothetical protein n=1 Tax=Virgibacillus salexigens TaxID=61016 RepID=UPI00190E54CA|nr:hypothetical protein [Virgibacillus salexigens]
MQVFNKSDERKILIEAGYFEAHCISEALSMYRLSMAALHGKDSEEEIKIEKLRYMIMNPTVKRTRNGMEEHDE